MEFSSSEETIKNFIQSKGYRVERFTKEEIRIQGNKTPDFKVFEGENLSLYCEVKEIEDFPIDRYNGNSEPDKDEDKVLALINNSCNQFLSVNPQHNIPNILAVYNRRLGTDILDFKFAFEGRWTTASGKSYPRPNRDAFDRIAKKKANIDMCLWYDDTSKKFTLMYLENSIFLDKLKVLFDLKL